MPTLLLSRPDRVGDVILATACLEPIRQQRPDLRLVFLARETMRPLLENHPLLDGFIALPTLGKRSFRADCQTLTRQMRARQIDALAHLHPDKLVQIAGRAAGIPQRIGYRHSWLLDALTLTHRLPDGRRKGHKHEAEFNFDLLAPLGIMPPASADGLRPHVHLDERWRESLNAKFLAANPNQIYAVLNPTAHSLPLRWPAAAFAQLAREAAGRLGRIVLVAERADDPSILEIRRLLGDNLPELTDLSGALNLAELGWLLRGARVLVSRNTGTAHLAAAAGCPVVELFGRLESVYGPMRWRALGDKTAVVTAQPSEQRWGESKREYWKRSYAAIPVSEVLEAALRMVGSA